MACGEGDGISRGGVKVPSKAVVNVPSNASVGGIRPRSDLLIQVAYSVQFTVDYTVSDSIIRSGRHGLSGLLTYNQSDVNFYVGFRTNYY
jgi:hypothetical protein